MARKMKIAKDEHGTVIYPFHPDEGRYAECVIIYPAGSISLSKGDWRHLSVEDARLLVEALLRAVEEAEKRQK